LSDGCEGKGYCLSLKLEKKGGRDLIRSRCTCVFGGREEKRRFTFRPKKGKRAFQLRGKAGVKNVGRGGKGGTEHSVAPLLKAVILETGEGL